MKGWFTFFFFFFFFFFFLFSPFLFFGGLVCLLGWYIFVFQRRVGACFCFFFFFQGFSCVCVWWGGGVGWVGWVGWGVWGGGLLFFFFFLLRPVRLVEGPDGLTELAILVSSVAVGW